MSSLFEIIFSEKIGTTKAHNENHTLMDLDSDGSWSGIILDTEYTSYTNSDDVYYTIAFKCSPFGIYSHVMQGQYEAW